MTQLVWNAVGERVFEAGVDRGVLYIDGADGVAWNGLVSVDESPSGGDVTPLYIDGIKYLNEVSAEEFEATIEAYTYPEEFAQCDGTLPVMNGLFATQQPKKSFGLSYRSKVGNDIDGLDHAYKIHVVYNATASPSDRQHHTQTETIEPSNFSWKIVTKPPRFTGYKPTAHFVIDSRETPSALLQQITDILYGTSSAAPRLPSIVELLFIFENYQASVFDEGNIIDPNAQEFFTTFDAGYPPSTPQTSFIDGGTP